MSPHRVTVATTGKDAERVKTVGIGRARPRPVSVISLGEQGGLPGLAPGDQLLISAEVEVTTDCEEQGRWCAEKAYGYSPQVEAQLLIADGPARAKQSTRARVLKTQRRAVNHMRHHDVFVFADVPYRVPAGGLPWQGPTFVNVAIGASHQSANGHVVLIGQNEPDGSVSGDMSSISVVHSRPADVPTPREIVETKRQATSIPVVQGAKRIVYARELANLRRGEQLVVKANVVTSAAHLAYPARGTVEVLLCDDPTKPDPGGEAKRITALGGRICPRNGRNCLKAESPMTSAKAGLVRIEKDARIPLYVIAVLETGDPRRQAKKGDDLRIAAAGSLRIIRYGPELAG